MHVEVPSISRQWNIFRDRVFTRGVELLLSMYSNDCYSATNTVLVGSACSLMMYSGSRNDLVFIFHWLIRTCILSTVVFDIFNSPALTGRRGDCSVTWDGLYANPIHQSYYGVQNAGNLTSHSWRHEEKNSNSTDRRESAAGFFSKNTSWACNFLLSSFLFFCCFLLW